MKLLSQQLYGRTAAQSSTIGWKECVCGKSGTGTFQHLGNLQLGIAGGNPEFYFTTFQESTVTSNSGDDLRNISFVYGWRVNTGGGIDNPSGNGAASFVGYQREWNAESTDWSYWDLGTRTITWRASSASVVSTTIQRVSVYSERIDLITLYCV